MFRRMLSKNNFVDSRLLGQDDFYQHFLHDVQAARREIVIESPFITVKRLRMLLPILESAVACGVDIIVNTKPLIEHEPEYYQQTMECVAALQSIGVTVLFTGGHHRKIAIIDRNVLYEGSLNILSQNESCEMMRRIKSDYLADQMLSFINIRHLI